MSSIQHEVPERVHVALVYQNEEEQRKAVADYLNEGLNKGYFCVFATIHYRDEGHVKALSDRINGYQENIDKGNLLVIDLASYYLAALIHDLRPFHEAKRLFEENVKGRSNRHIRFVGDGTGFLFRNRHFDECAMVEEWWQQKPFEGSYLCLHQKQHLDLFPQVYTRVIRSTHDSVVNSSWNKIDNRQLVTTSGTVGHKSNDDNVSDRGAS